MRKFLLGLIAGILLGGSIATYAAGVFGDGYLMGWTVTKDGEEVCSDPFTWPGIKEIECD